MNNKSHSGPKPSEGFILQAKFLPLYSALNENGWQGTTASTSRDREGNDIQHMELRKICSQPSHDGKSRELHLRLQRKSGKVRCVMYRSRCKIAL